MAAVEPGDRLGPAWVRSALTHRAATALVVACLVLAGSFAAAGIRGVDLLIVGLVVLAAIALSLLQRGEDRALALAVFAAGFALRAGVVAVLGFAGLSVVSLGPDATAYWAGAQRLSSDQFALGVSPVTAFGSYDVAHYYLFGAVAWLGGGLPEAQLVNAGIGALVAPAMLGWSRLLIPRHAAWIGLGVALYPSLIVMSATSLLKDPSVLLALALCVWSLTALAKEQRIVRRSAFALLALSALLYLNLDRFYLATLVEIGVAVAAGLRLVRDKRAILRAAPALVLAVIVASELLPAVIGWPPTPVRFQGNVEHVAATPELQEYGPSNIDFTFGPLGTLNTIVTPVAAVVRRLYGPFIWVPPASWDPGFVLRSDLLLYPGNAIWYAMLPVGLAGLALTLRRYRVADPALVAVAFTLPLYLLAYVSVNLSYRQRDLMVPFVLSFALPAAVWITQDRRARLAYIAYWVLLVAGAAAHLALRSALAKAS